MRRQELIVLSTVVIVSLFLPAIALAEDYTWSDNGDGTCTITDYTGPGGDVTIPDTLGGLTVTIIGNQAFYGYYNLTSVIIPNSVTTIGYQAFYGSSLTSVTIGNSVTTIGGQAFRYCSGLASVTIGSSVTTIGGDAFSYCSVLTNVTFPASVTTIEGYAFHACSALTSITIPDSITAINDGVFADCRDLTSVTIPDSVGTIGDRAFDDCWSLTSITIPESVGTIGDWAFYNSGLTSINIPDSVITIGICMFHSCSDLTSVTIGNSVTAIGNSVFSFCPSLTSITIPDSVGTIGDWAFNDSGLTSVTIGNSVTTIGNCVFHSCSGLTSVYFRGDVPSCGENVFTYPSNATAYYIPGTLGWAATFGGIPTVPMADMEMDGKIDFSDFARLADYWLESNCQESYNWCERADIDMSGDVGLSDLLLLANQWLAGTYPSSYCLDNFDDNLMGSIWTMMAPNEPNLWLDETNQRLEVRSTGVVDDVALYVPNGWYLDTSQDFGIKIRYHNELDSETWAELLFSLAASSEIKNNHLQFSVCSLDRGPYFYYELTQNGSQIDELYITRLSNDGWIFISYDTVLDEVYFGINGYGPANAVKTVPGLLQGDWSGKQIGPHIGGSSEYFEVLSGQAYWDDLIMDY